MNENGFLKENGPQILQIWKCHPREEKVWITASYLCPLQNSLSLIIFIPLPLWGDEMLKSCLHWSPSKWRMNLSKCPFKQHQVHLASRTHFVDLVIHDTCSQKIIPYFADLVIHNICSQKIMPYFFDKLSTSIRNFAQWASTFCFSFLNCFRFWVKFFLVKNFWVKIFLDKKNFWGRNFWIKFFWVKIY